MTKRIYSQPEVSEARIASMNMICIEAQNHFNQPIRLILLQQESVSKRIGTLSYC